MCGCICIHQVTLLYSRNWHNNVNQIYFYFKKQNKQKKTPLVRKSVEKMHQKIKEVNFKRERNIWDAWINRIS